MIRQIHQKKKYDVGETAEIDDVSLTLRNVTENSGGNYMTPGDGNVFILCELEIENNSKKEIEIGISSLVLFTTYVDDYSVTTSLSATLASDKQPQLDGTVADGKKMNGVVGYEASATIEIDFKENVWLSKNQFYVQ